MLSKAGTKGLLYTQKQGNITALEKERKESVTSSIIASEK